VGGPPVLHACGVALRRWRNLRSSVTVGSVADALRVAGYAGDVDPLLALLARLSVPDRLHLLAFDAGLRRLPRPSWTRSGPAWTR
jgi:hypothetical protein